MFVALYKPQLKNDDAARMPGERYIIIQITLYTHTHTHATTMANSGETQDATTTLAQWAWDYVSAAIWGAGKHREEDGGAAAAETSPTLLAAACDARSPRSRLRSATARELSDAFARLRSPTPVEPRSAPPSLEKQLQDEIVRRRAMYQSHARN